MTITDVYAGMSMAFAIPFGEGSLNRAFVIAKVVALVLFAAAVGVLAYVCSAAAEVPVTVVVPAGVQRNPAGGFALNGDAWFGDSVNGVVHYARNADGTYSVDLRDGFTIPGVAGPLELVVRQVYQVSPQLALVAVSDGGKGSDNRPAAGIYTIGFDPSATGLQSPLGNFTHLVPDKGLAGATSVTFGPDLKPYVGFAGKPDLVRINGNQVEPVGSALNGQPILSLAVNNQDVYLATGDGLYVVPNAPACQGNKNNCGRPVLLAGGATVALANDNAGHLYFSQVIGVVRRLDIATGAIVTVHSGFSFGPETAGLMLEADGSLLIAELSQVDRVLASDLASLQ